MYKIEPHLHTACVSRCGKLDAEALAAGYHAAGYHAIAVTDHYNVDTWKHLGVEPVTVDDVMPYFMQGYRQMQAACAPYGITVYLGAELRFYECENDYLFYGFDPALLAHPHEIMDMGIARFSALARQTGGLLLQAHPFRKTCVPVAPMLLDGVEVFNANPRHMHHNHNELAWALAEREGASFVRTAGSDCHQTPDIARSGILSPILPQDSMAFAALLRSGRYELIYPPEQA